MTSMIGRRPAAAAPTPAPTNPASEIGVSRTRSGPKSGKRLLVAPKEPPMTFSRSPPPPAPPTTSSPITITLSSTSMACRMASPMASIIERARSAPTTISDPRLNALLGVGIAGDLGRIRERARAGELDGMVDRGVDLGLERPQLVGRRVALVEEPPSQERKRIERAERLTLLVVPIAIGVALEVPEEAVRPQLEERGPRTRASAFDRLTGRLVHGEHVARVDGEPGKAVALGAQRDLGNAGRIGGGRRLGIAVVLADVDDRQLPDRSKVEALVKHALVGRSVAEEGDGHLVRLADASGKTRSGG